jgi:hypothetical protein
MLATPAKSYDHPDSFASMFGPSRPGPMNLGRDIVRFLGPHPVFTRLSQFTRLARGFPFTAHLRPSPLFALADKSTYRTGDFPYGGDGVSFFRNRAEQHPHDSLTQPHCDPDHPHDNALGPLRRQPLYCVLFSTSTLRSKI